MGLVYEAEQMSLGRHVALKLLPSNMLIDAKAKRRVEREAKAAARLHHTNIVPVFGIGEQDGMPYYVMQFIEGLGLDAVLEELKKLQLDHLRDGAHGRQRLVVCTASFRPDKASAADSEPTPHRDFRPQVSPDPCSRASWKRRFLMGAMTGSPGKRASLRARTSRTKHQRPVRQAHRGPRTKDVSVNRPTRARRCCPIRFRSRARRLRYPGENGMGASPRTASGPTGRAWP